MVIMGGEISTEYLKLYLRYCRTLLPLDNTLMILKRLLSFQSGINSCIWETAGYNHSDFERFHETEISSQFSGNLMRSSYIWLPLTISGSTATLNNYLNWVVDLNTGAMGAGPGETVYEAETAAISGGARSMTCSGCSGSIVGYIGAESGVGGTLQFSSVSSSASTLTTVRFKHSVRPFFIGFQS